MRGGTRERVVLVHSLAMDMSFWHRLVPLLLTHASVLVYDCRGHGGSDKPDGPYTIELFADDLADLLDHVGWPSAVIAGASMGGCIAIAFAAAYPARAEGLGLIDTTAWYGPDAPRLWAERGARARTEGLGALGEFQRSRWFSDGFRSAHPDIVEKAVAVFLANDVDTYVATCRMLGSVDKRAALAAFGMPTAIVVGEDDYATPVAMAHDLASAIKGSVLHIVAGARHFVPLEAPGAVAADLAALLGAPRG